MTQDFVVAAVVIEPARSRSLGRMRIELLHGVLVRMCSGDKVTVTAFPDIEIAVDELFS